MSARHKKHNPLVNPDMYKNLRGKGTTEVGTHVPVLVEEVMAILRPLPGGIVADCTLGYGGLQDLEIILQCFFCPAEFC